MNKKIVSSPLPFQGQKRNFVKQFKEALNQYPDNAVFVDLFGGSGLLSNVVKQEKPNARVIYNDHDNFRRRLSAIPTTNKLLQDLRVLLGHIERKKKISEHYKQQVLKLVKSYDDKTFVDYITLSSSILFTMKYVTNFEELTKETLYNNVRKSNYDEANNYLKGVEFVSDDYKIIFDEYKHDTNVVFIVDPPYLSTDSTTYKNYWKLKDYLDVLLVLKQNKYFYFTSNKSSIVELCEWIETNTAAKSPFNGAKVKYQYNVTSKTSSYTDIMLYKNWTTNHT